MNKPNLTLAAFCANTIYTNITDRIKIILYLPEDRDDGFEDKGRYLKLQEGATARNLAIYGQWYVTEIDASFESKDNLSIFELTIQEKPAY